MTNRENYLRLRHRKTISEASSFIIAISVTNFCDLKLK